MIHISTLKFEIITEVVESSRHTGQGNEIGHIADHPSDQNNDLLREALHRCII